MVKFAYQEWPHPKDTASPHSQNVDRKREQHVLYIDQFQSKISIVRNVKGTLFRWSIGFNQERIKYWKTKQ
jgi:hypothetical protein